MTNRVLVVGVPRSATTWLAEMLSATPGSRAVLEPDNPAWNSAAHAARRLYGSFPSLHQGESAPEFEQLWDRAFSDGDDPALPNLVVKSVHSVLSMDWLVDRYSPHVVMIERNPLNVVASWMQHGFEVGDLATNEAARIRYIEPLELPPWDPYAPRILQVAWAIGVLMSAMRLQARSHTDWTVMSHDATLADTSGRMRELAESVGLEWSAAAEQRLRASDAPGSGAETKRVVSTLGSRWRAHPAVEMQAVIRYLAQFPELADLLPDAGTDDGGHVGPHGLPASEAGDRALPPPIGPESGLQPNLSRGSLLRQLDRARAEVLDGRPLSTTHNADLRYLAFYVPQFHARQSGGASTDWTHVREATPRFPGHYQPHLPAGAMGSYDLGDPATRELQAALARKYGVDGFVYHHHWSPGSRLADETFNAVLASGRPTFPFCLCWANEGRTHAPDDDLAHIGWLVRAFGDPRYIRVKGRPLLLVSRARQLPDPRSTAETWRREGVRLGVGEPYLCCVERSADDRVDPQELGFDAAVEFLAGAAGWHRKGPQLTVAAANGSTQSLRSRTYSYPIAAELAAKRPSVAYKRFRCVTPGWDDSPRVPAQPTVFVGSSPALYERWLSRVAAEFTPYSDGENLVFINAWNDWEHGNHLEPDVRWGYGYLEAHLNATGRGGS